MHFAVRVATPLFSGRFLGTACHGARFLVDQVTLKGRRHQRNSRMLRSKLRSSPVTFKPRQASQQIFQTAFTDPLRQSGFKSQVWVSPCLRVYPLFGATLLNPETHTRL